MNNSANNVSELVSESTPFSTTQRTLSKIGIELSEFNGFYELWRGDKFTAKFPADSKALADEANLYISMHNDRVREASKKMDAIDSALEGSTQCSILDERGNVIATAKVRFKRGMKINVAGAFTRNGTPVNVQPFAVSSSKSNLEKSRKLNVPSLCVKLIDSEIYYYF